MAMDTDTLMTCVENAELNTANCLKLIDIIDTGSLKQLLKIAHEQLVTAVSILESEEE